MLKFEGFEGVEDLYPEGGPASSIRRGNREGGTDVSASRQPEKSGTTRLSPDYQ